jgi:RNA polymerase sigma-70 factor (ECF subfamily)
MAFAISKQHWVTVTTSEDPSERAHPGSLDEEEARFIQRLRQRDPHAFNELVVTFEARVFRLVWRMVGRHHEAEDMTQEVFVQVFKAIEQFRGDSQLSTWIYRIAINLCKNRSKYNERRYRKGHQEFNGDFARSTDGALGVTAGETTRPDQLVQGYQMEQLVQRALFALEPDYREVLILRDVENLPYEDIITITGLPEGTVKSRLHRARSQLQSALEAALGEKLR